MHPHPVRAESGLGPWAPLSCSSRGRPTTATLDSSAQPVAERWRWHACRGGFALWCQGSAEPPEAGASRAWSWRREPRRAALPGALGEAPAQSDLGTSFLLGRVAEPGLRGRRPRAGDPASAFHSGALGPSGLRGPWSARAVGGARSGRAAIGRRLGRAPPLPRARSLRLATTRRGAATAVPRRAPAIGGGAGAGARLPADWPRRAGAGRART